MIVVALVNQPLQGQDLSRTFNMDISTLGGDVKVSTVKGKIKGTGQVNGGKNKVKIRTTNGNVAIHEAR